MKLHDTTYEYSNTMRTFVSNGKLQMPQGLKLKCEFLPRFLLFLIAICLTLVKVTLIPCLVTFLSFFLSFKARSRYF